MDGKDAQTDIDAPKKNPLCHLRIHELSPDTLPGGDPVLYQGMGILKSTDDAFSIHKFFRKLSISNASIDGGNGLLTGAAVDDDVEGRLDVST